MDTSPNLPAANGNPAPKPPSWWERVIKLRTPAIVLLAFLFVLAIVYWQTPIRPAATLVNDEHCWRFCFSPDSSTIVSAVGENPFSESVLVWDVALRQRRYSVVGDGRGPDPVRFSPDSRMFGAYTKNGDIKIWNTQAGTEIATVNTQSQKSGQVFWVEFCFSPDSRFIVIEDFWGRSHVFWNIERGQEQGNIDADRGKLALAPDGKSAAAWIWGEKNCKLQQWSIHSDQPPRLEKEHLVGGRTAAFSVDLKKAAIGRQLSATSSEISLYDMATGAKQWSITSEDPEYPLGGLSFTADGRILIDHRRFPAPASAMGVPTKTTLWDISSNPHRIGAVEPYAELSPDAELIAVPTSAGAQLFATATMEKKATLIDPDDELSNSAADVLGVYPEPCFSYDGKLVAVRGLYFSKEPTFSEWIPANINPFPGGDRALGVRLWDAQTGQELMGFEHCNEAHFSPNGKYVATLDESGVTARPLLRKWWHAKAL